MRPRRRVPGAAPTRPPPARPPRPRALRRRKTPLTSCSPDGYAPAPFGGCIARYVGAGPAVHGKCRYADAGPAVRRVYIRDLVAAAAPFWSCAATPNVGGDAVRFRRGDGLRVCERRLGRIVPYAAKGGGARAGHACGNAPFRGVDRFYSRMRYPARIESMA